MAKFRIKTAAVSAVCLISGLAIYLFMRENTHFHLMLPENVRNFSADINAGIPSNILTDFLRYYFVDFLWGASLASALCAVSYEIKKKNIIISALVSFVVGAVFELLQHFSLVNGTFDFADIAMYAAASLVCAAVSVKFLEE